MLEEKVCPVAPGRRCRDAQARFPGGDIVGVHNTPPFVSSIMKQRELPLDREQAGHGREVNGLRRLG